ncbi:hydroxymethylglutaryl-CoA lyase [Methylocystis parvus]|uniref:hydroxymethylglutaryl-CoA lyase n=1 Tax=Methylocystis parvus TaxID=134 RepID=A0A6B8M967_9HYPH|nr:hydroxymethylglutaryl-CoA lyase [Methylocystis parvus]QGM97843.1 hydroxymethylglutaryl-CoA lyase [Methylocystis parvus]WBK01848.1 hydroxymethylglutaryl-CoA lyase [Methylocystis parvus OBBP]
MKLPDRIRIVEVGPRDGLQNERAILPVATRIELIERLAAAGLRSIEAGSFVPARLVPQMAETAAVLAGVDPCLDATLSVLVPNEIGLQAALAAGAREVAMLAAASETFSRKNLNCGIDENLERLRPVARAAKEGGLRLRGYVSCAFGCPFEGRIDPAQTISVANALHRLGCDEISLGDTIGVAAPLPARKLVEALSRDIPIERLAGHFHDTYGQALANIFACLEIGLTIFDASVAGLGGCPFAPGAAGNVATEDVVYMLQGSGIDTGVDLERLLDAGDFICARLGRAPESRVAHARRACSSDERSARQIPGG